MKKTLIILWLMLSTTSVFGADICQWNICIDPSGNIYIKNSETISSSLLSWTTTGNITTTGTIKTGSILSIPLTGNIITGNINTTIVNTEDKKNSIPSPIFKNPTEELNAAILRWYNNDLTIHNSIIDYKADNLVLREEAAKIFYKTALFTEYKDTNNSDCMFTDISDVSESLKGNIKNICELWWIMRWNKWIFSPKNTLSYAQTVTIIARISWIKDTSTSSARRTPYFNHVKKLWIIKNININESNMENKISRWELIILLYRLSNIYNNNWWNFNFMWESTAISDLELPSDTNSSNSLVSIGAGVVDTPKFTTALLWMYNADMTIFWKASDYDPFNVLTREQASKLLFIYNKKFNTNTGSISPISCNYTDIKGSSLQEYIIDACQKWIFKNTTTFNPNNAIIKSEFVTAILNMLQEKPITGQTVANKALELEIISKADLNTFDKPITRYEVALLLSSLHIKTQFINNLKDKGITYNVIAPIEKDTNIYPDWQQKVFIDINSIDSKEFNNWFINLFGNSYKITKKEIITYFPTSYSWYGEITDITNDNEIGSISMAISQKWWTKVLIEGFIAFPEKKEIYSIYPTVQIPYYMITRIK